MIGTQALLELDAAGAPQVDTVFTFNQYITAFGLFVIQGGDGANNNPTTFRLRNTSTNAFVDVPVQVGPGWGTDNAFFLGVTDTVPFNEVQILESRPISQMACSTTTLWPAKCPGAWFVRALDFRRSLRVCRAVPAVVKFRAASGCVVTNLRNSNKTVSERG